VSAAALPHSSAKEFSNGKRADALAPNKRLFGALDSKFAAKCFRRERAFRNFGTFRPGVFPLALWTFEVVYDVHRLRLGVHNDPMIRDNQTGLA
jgi:hypothetical protein